MFHSFTLYPGGAFMMCESVGEFDENVPLPTPQETPAAVMAPMVEQCDDPVIKTTAVLSAVYERSIVPMLSMDQTFDGEDAQAILHKLETISTGISDIANSLRKSIGKLSGMVRVFGRDESEYATETFTSHLGFFMKNASTVKRQGIEFSEYSFNAIPAFQSTWRIQGLVTALHNTPEMLDEILYAATLNKLVGGDSDRVTDTFESTIDILRCVYSDPERMSRLECRLTRRIAFDDLLGNRRYCGEVCACDDSDKVCRKMYCMLSENLRSICRQCYDMQCQVIDGDLEAGEFTRNVAKLLSRSVNLFAIGTLLAMAVATQLREVVAYKQGVDSYTKLLLDTLKTV